MMPALAGASNIYGSGMLELGMSFSLEQLVADDCIIGMIKYARHGIEVNEDTLSYEAIKRVGIGNDFLGDMDTLAHVDLPSRPTVFDRNMFETWTAEGSREAIDIAHGIVEDILAHHEPTPIDADVRKELAGKSGGNVAAATLVGKRVAEKALQAGITEVAFDRSGFRYHGRVKALAEAMRENGVKF